MESELGNLANAQTNPEGPARLTRRVIMDLVLIVIVETEYSTAFGWNPALTSCLSLTSCSVTQVTRWLMKIQPLMPQRLIATQVAQAAREIRRKSAA